MAIKSFNIAEDTYSKYSKFCRGYGISMSKQVEMFMEAQLEEEPKAKKEYLEKLDRISKGKFRRVKNFAKEFGLE